MKNMKIKAGIIACAFIGCLAIGAISAYFTDADAAVNTFTVGKISIDLQEPSWVPPVNITPEQEFEKDPQVKNDGINDCYVFLEVIVPYENVVTANKDGTKNAAADTELFSYTVNDGWVEIGTAAKDADSKTITHLYAYGTAEKLTVLAKDASTPAIFNAVKFANVVEDYDLEGSTQNIVLNAYAIQTANLNNGDTIIDGTNTEGKSAPAEVWEIIKNHNPSTDVGVAEDPNTDIKQ